MKRKTAVIPALIVLSLLIWGHNAFRIFLGIAQNDAESGDGGSVVESINTGADTSGAQKPRFVYSEKIRDPFQPAFWPEQPGSKLPVRKTTPRPEPKPSLPALRFCGVVRDPAGSLALVEGPDGETRLLRETESIAEVRVTAIEPGRIECEFNKEKMWLELRP